METNYYQGNKQGESRKNRKRENAYNPKLIAQPLAEEINNKLNLLLKSGHRYHFNIVNKLEHNIEVEANIHSARLEDEDSYKKYLCNKASREIKNARKQFLAAMVFGFSNFKPGYINNDFIKQLAGIIEPSLSCSGGMQEFRTVGVRPSGAIHTPPYPEKILYEMDEFLKELNLFLLIAEEEKKNDNLIPAVEAALLAHFHLVRIHPFEDGNGRTSRLLQNIILRHYHIPPPIIYNGEKIDYCERLENAIGGYLSRKGIYPDVSSEERSFYNYLASKINVSLDSVLEQLKSSKGAKR